MQPRFEQGLVGVDVAHTGYDTLIEQDRLQATLRRGQTRVPVVGLQIERLGSQSAIVKEASNFVIAGKQRGAAEAANIAKTQLPAAIQIKNQMRVRQTRPL